MGRKWDKLITFCSIWGIKWEIFNVFLGGFDFSDNLLRRDPVSCVLSHFFIE
jgi:hypothetical protein